MSVFRLISLVFLAFAFGVLVWTFVWVAKLLARREAEAAAASVDDADPAVPPAAPIAEPEPAADAEAAEDAEAEAEELQRRKVGTGVNATLGLLLSILACLLFWLSPFVMILAAGGIYFSANAAYLGLRLFRVFILRAAIGLVLGVASVVAFFAHRVGQFDGILPP